MPSIEITSPADENGSSGEREIPTFASKDDNLKMASRGSTPKGTVTRRVASSTSQNMSSSPKKVSSPSLKAPVSESPSSGKKQDTSSSTSIRSSKVPSSQLKHLREMNPICCDCTAQNPSWVNCGLGVLICIQCASIHRSFASCSHIKSLSLDDITEDDIKMLKSVGNDVFNKRYLEEKEEELEKRRRSVDQADQSPSDIPEDTQITPAAAAPPPEARIDANAPSSQRKLFILEKYQQQSGVTPESLEAMSHSSTSPKQSASNSSTSTQHNTAATTAMNTASAVVGMGIHLLRGGSPKHNTEFGHVEFKGIIKIRLLNGQNLFLREKEATPFVVFQSASDDQRPYPGQEVKSAITEERTSSPEWNSSHTVSVRDLDRDVLLVKVFGKHRLFTHLIGRSIIKLNRIEFGVPFSVPLSRKAFHFVGAEKSSGSIQLSLEFIDLDSS